MPDLDVAWLADVRANVQVPVMADESVYTLQDAMAVVRAGAADVLSTYVSKGGRDWPSPQNRGCGRGCWIDLHRRQQFRTGRC